MQSIHRQFEKMRSKGAVDDAKVAVLLQDFTNADQVLTSIIETSKAWRDSWISILIAQVGMAKAFDELYEPVMGATSEEHGHEPVLTSEVQRGRTTNLHKAFAELKADLLDELGMIDQRVIRPSTDARESIQPLKKTIKKRENKRLDYESYLDRLEKRRRAQKSEKDDVGITKLEADVARAADEFQYADTHLREALPPVVASAFALLPHLLATLIMTQNTLLAQYYTTLYNYSTQEGFPSPPPPVEDVTAQWERDFKGIQDEVEAINTIARGKAVHCPMHQGDNSNASKGSSMTGFNLRNGLAARRTSSQTTIAQSSGRPNLKPRIPSFSSVAPPSESPRRHATPQQSEIVEESEGSGGSWHATPHQPNAKPMQDRFHDLENSRERSRMSIAAGKKKAPPPPPPKRLQSSKEQWVTALYTFIGQEEGDLSFEERDKIKVIKRTDSVDDWWDGELNGVRGRFPANYVGL